MYNLKLLKDAAMHSYSNTGKIKLKTMKMRVPAIHPNLTRFPEICKKSKNLDWSICLVNTIRVDSRTFKKKTSLVIISKVSNYQNIHYVQQQIFKKITKEEMLYIGWPSQVLNVSLLKHTYIKWFKNTSYENVLSKNCKPCCKSLQYNSLIINNNYC